ncbi:LLM class F420-dependent oxidoreductase [Streptomyces sp. PSKA54]|uniref:LLM class F420-dependent oxidoreductase n=1 Tax=Streptomyces himalayensis subsp. aureolus TaxID=2758039 RepID=A0A7W2HKK3_9ACTN|nr:LLM class F420-dependent oxidoreductase [Streptomyces himalayensis]MBA4867257.1 LLM class F420-dependent oxidoreductase [Streptomyces himalayensis subsp. aureolus]
MILQPSAPPAPEARWGVSIPFADIGLAEQVDQYRRLADSGYTDFWSLEATGWDAFTPLSMVAAFLPQARFGTAIVPVFTRGAATLAGQAAAMAELCGDRFTLGIGASTRTIVEHWNGLPYEEPFHRTRDTLRFLQRALNGEKVTEEFRTFSVRGYRLDRPPAQPPRMMVAALRSGMLKLAGSESDGAILSWLAVEDVPRISAIVGEGKSLAARLFVCPSTDRDRVLAIARRQIAWYANAPVYQAFHEWAGRSEAFTPMWSRWDAGDRRGALEVIPEPLVDDLVINGPPEACAEHVRRYQAAGVQIPILHFLTVDSTSFKAAMSLATANTRSAA